MQTTALSTDVTVSDARQGAVRLRSRSYAQVVGSELGLVLTEDEASKLMFVLAARYGYEVREK